MNIAVYLGSSTTCLPEYNDLAYELGRQIALCGHTLVYGGADVGTMRYLADGALAEGGRVVGVFPDGFQGTAEVIKEGIEVKKMGLTEMILVKDFAERKQKMEDLSDCAVVMPGSFGTLDEMFTYACNYAIGQHRKPVYLLNHKGFYDPMRALMDNVSAAGFLKPSSAGVLHYSSDVALLLEDIAKL